MRYFEKISFNQFKNNVDDNIDLYNSYNLPKRSTKNSAGYDFESLVDYTLKSGESKLIPLGIKAKMEDDEFLMLVVRSSFGVKHNIRLCNQVGIIDSDYYNNSDNEGHIFIKLKNEGTKDFEIKKHDKICQGIFMKYLVVTDEEKIEKVRTSGFGSTNEGE